MRPRTVLHVVEGEGEDQRAWRVEWVQNLALPASEALKLVATR